MRCHVCDFETSGMSLSNHSNARRKFFQTPTGDICEDCSDEADSVMQDFYEDDLETGGDDAFEYDGETDEDH